MSMRTTRLSFGCLAAFTIIGLFSAKATADTIVYAYTAEEEWGTVDLNTGTFNLIRTAPSLDSYLFQLNFAAGFGVANGNLYDMHFDAAGNNALYQVDPATDAETFVGESGNSAVQGFGSTANGLYAVTGTFGGPFYFNTVDPVTGALTQIGPTGFTNTSVSLDVSAISDTGVLYAASGPNLYSIDTSTGAATLIGSTGTPDTPESMLFEDGILYASYSNQSGPDPPYTIYTINTATGLASVLSTGVEGPSAYASPYATPLGYFVPDPIPPAAVPEPSSLAMVGFVMVLCTLKCWLKLLLSVTCRLRPFHPETERRAAHIIQRDPTGDLLG
jgi:hypothetical protein